MESTHRAARKERLPWHLHRANRSPRYRTNCDELMVAYTDEGARFKKKSYVLFFQDQSFNTI
ncbi:DUF4113 domain-containing protein [Halomonas sp. GT]|uniref:DUF4113 domain-containing protein n=1 Tax=Halomonas sp. GT TaxID=1971364 RepID=UPI003FA59BB2